MTTPAQTAAVLANPALASLKGMLRSGAAMEQQQEGGRSPVDGIVRSARRWAADQAGASQDTPHGIGADHPVREFFRQDLSSVLASPHGGETLVSLYLALQPGPVGAVEMASGALTEALSRATPAPRLTGAVWDLLPRLYDTPLTVELRRAIRGALALSPGAASRLASALTAYAEAIAPDPASDTMTPGLGAAVARALTDAAVLTPLLSDDDAATLRAHLATVFPALPTGAQRGLMAGLALDPRSWSQGEWLRTQIGADIDQHRVGYAVAAAAITGLRHDIPLLRTLLRIRFQTDTSARAVRLALRAIRSGTGVFTGEELALLARSPSRPVRESVFALAHAMVAPVGPSATSAEAE